MSTAIKNTIDTGMEYRSLDLMRETINEENRTVEISFSSEYPVERFFGDEILDHSPDSVRLGRLQRGGPVLMGHNDDQVGVVESASIDADRKGRAVVRFGKTSHANDVFTDVVDGIRRNVSVGYRIHKMQLVEETAAKETYRAVDWEPYELSFVSVPADPTVGVGRNSEKTFKTEVIMNDVKNDPTESLTGQKRAAEPLAAPAPVVTVDYNAEAEKVRNAELDRVDTIRKIGEKYQCDDLAREYINSRKSIEDMTTATLSRIGERSQESAPLTQLGFTEKETRNYSMFRAIRASLSKDWSRAGFELEASQAIEDQLGGREARGFYVPMEVQQRVMTAGVAAAGGNLVGSDHLAGSFIDTLRAESVVGRLGARVLDGLVGDVDIPRLDSGATFTWVAEDGSSVDTDGVLGSVVLTPKTIAGSVPMSRRLLKQSSPSVEQTIMDDLAAGAALAIDLAALEGTGAANQPTGITATTGVGTVTIAAALGTGYPTHAELVEFETDVATANGLRGSLAYVTTAAIRGGMKTTAIDAGSGIMLAVNDMANGYELAISTQLSAKRIIYGNFNDVLLGMWGVLDVVADQATKAASGGLVLRAFQDIDIGIRHAGSFSINA